MSKALIRRKISRCGRELSQSAKLVLLDLVERTAQGSPVAWPSQATLGEDVGLGYRQIRRALNELWDKGLIGIERGRRRNGGNVYELDTYALLEWATD